MPNINTDHHYLNHKKNPLCIHKRDFTNAIYTNETELFKFSLLQTQFKSWEDIMRSSHCHPIEDDNDKKRIKDYLGLSKKQFNNLKIEPAICQIPIGQKFRAFVVFRKKQLYLLFFDPNHHFFPNKFEYPQGDNAICLIKCLTKKGNCSKFYECHPLPEKERRRLISKREREKK